MPRYEYVEGSSSKFWEIEISGASVTTRWGRIGTAGQEKTKDFASAEKARAEYDALIQEKTGKGYRETGAAAAPAPPASRPAPASPPPPPPPPTAMVASEPNPEPPAVPAAEPAIAWTPELRKLVLPRRDNEVRPVVSSDPAEAWGRMRQRFSLQAPAWKRSRSLFEESLGSVVSAAVQKMEHAGDGLPPAADPEVEGALLVMLSLGDVWQEPALDGEIITVWAATGGLSFAVEALQASLRFQGASEKDLQEVWLNRKTVGGAVAMNRNEGFRHWWHLRCRLAAAGEAEWAAARDTAERLRAGATLDCRVPLAYLFPETGWAEEDAREAVPGGSRWKSGFLIPVVRDADLVDELIAKGDSGWVYAPEALGERDGLRTTALTLVDNLGTAAVTPLVRLLDGVNLVDNRQKVLAALAIVATPETPEALTGRLDSREVAEVLATFAARFPRVAVPVLAARSGREGPVVGSLLAQMVRRHQDVAAELLPGLPDPSRRAVEALLARTEVPPEAAPADLPPVLASPPWRRKEKRKEPPALDLPPLPWQDTVVWPEGERERWQAAAPAWYFLERRPPKERIGAALQSFSLANFGPWEELDDEALRRKIEQRLPAGARAQSTLCTLALLPDRLALALWDALPPSFWGSDDPPFRFLSQVEDRAIPGLVRFGGEYLSTVAACFLPFRSPRLAPLAAEALARLKSLRAEARRWLLAHDECAAAGLIPAAAGPAGKPMEMAVAALRFLAANGRGELILEVAGRWGGEAREAVRSMLATDPVDLFPARLPKLPSFWQPDGFTRPLLRGRTAALPLSAVEALGVLLAISPLDEPHAGLAQVKEACDPASLAAFAWDLFSAWLAAGAPSKEQWAFNALGHLGDDGCARRLAPLVREWPGEAAHARAVAGLDVLRAIGTDMALMHLHGISQKVKFKGLQNKAREKIAEIAEQRGLTPEDLADRLVPDLGLGADGTLVLDFGSRSFRVGFDESLKPFVRDGEGKRMADLPKPGKADDPEKAGEALEVWKTLKKGVKALAAHQILRLELAMCSRRRWEPDVFQAFFLEHPLLQHLVRRLVWGAWDAGDALAATFRVSEDGSLADAADEVWELPDGARVGIVHRLDLEDGIAARWGEVFADYEILQPFAQLGRDLYPITEEEKGARELKRLEGLTLPTGKVLGLVERHGWRRGPAQDGGDIWWFAKPLPGGKHEICLGLDPGIIVGMVMEYPEQKLRTVTIDRVGSWDPQGSLPFGRLDPITFSELVRDLEGLR